jgi:prepilin-type N-terminal cleavage/methylation domain-containing protein
MCRATASRWPSARAGYTLVEVVIVLILLGLAAALVAPSLFVSPPEQSSALQTLVQRSRDASVRRGEVVRLRIDRSGAWQVVAGAPPRRELLMGGRLGATSSAVELIFSPLGTCAPGVESDPVEVLAGLDPLTCEVPRR